MVENSGATISTHIFTRTVSYEPFLKEEWAKSLLVYVMWYITENYPIELNALTILDDHIHAVVTSPSEMNVLPEAMCVAKSMFSKEFNRRYGRIGPVWNNRYGRKHFEMYKNPDLYAIISLWYCAYNPVRKGYVSFPGEYQYDSINHYLIPDYKGILPITMHKAFLSLHEDEYKRIYIFRQYDMKFKNTMLMKSNIFNRKFEINPQLSI